MADPILQEIDEEVKRDQMAALWKQYQKPVVAAIAVVLLGVGGWQGFLAMERQKAEKSSTAFVASAQLEEEGKLDEAAKAFAALQQDGTKGFAALASFRLAAVLEQQGKGADQLAALQKAGDDAQLDPAQRELAVLIWAYHLLEQGKAAEAKAKVEALAQPSSVYPALHKEWLAMAALADKDVAGAQKLLKDIAEDATAPDALKERAKGVLSTLVGKAS